MDRYIRRALCTVLVAGGLAVAGASAAYAADPAVTGTATTAVAPGVGAAAQDADAGPSGRHVGREVLGALADGDVAAVVAAALGEDGLVADLLPDAPPESPESPESPGVDEPDTDLPGSDEPGVDEPGTDEPGTDEPGTDEPGTDEPGVDEPGTDLPGTDEPGTDEPGTDLPGTDQPGTDQPGTDQPGTDQPGTDQPGTDQPGTDHPGIDLPGTDQPGNDAPGVGRPGKGDGEDAPGTGTAPPVDDVETPRPAAENPGEVELTAGPGHDLTSPSAPVISHELLAGTEDLATPPAVEPELPEGGVDLRWRDRKPGPEPLTYEGTSILPGGLTNGYLGTAVEPVPEPEPEDETGPGRAPGDQTVRTGHMFTGQLSLISVLLGLGIAVLRTRRR
ncbi:hypothetical protein APR03_002429 [Promicromonospora thailandica]|uniref:Uncharacterized protein n=1 Tax=Promicromonospora thailandica TaxID=765201 RepID=A0A9X2JVH5_9MICO|nr:hypothetical protein [Promicromonospora thailandica]MCP2265081.1 hypothetical protein [Promicromonospora thailandica]